jgi:hypothetical protein
MSQFWLQNPNALFESFCIFPFNQTTPQGRGNAFARLLFIVAIVALLFVPAYSRDFRSILLVLLLVNLILGVTLWTSDGDNASLLHFPNQDQPPQHRGNPYGNPTLYSHLPAVPYKTDAPMHGERPGDTCELSDGFFFNSVPDRTLQARFPFSPLPNDTNWLGDAMPYNVHSILR